MNSIPSKDGKTRQERWWPRPLYKRQCLSCLVFCTDSQRELCPWQCTKSHARAEAREPPPPHCLPYLIQFVLFLFFPLRSWAPASRPTLPTVTPRGLSGSSVPGLPIDGLKYTYTAFPLKRKSLSQSLMTENPRIDSRTLSNTGGHAGHLSGWALLRLY